MDSEYTAAGYDYRLKSGAHRTLGAWKIVSDWKDGRTVRPFLKFLEQRWTHPRMRAGERVFVVEQGGAAHGAFDAGPLHLKATGEYGPLTPLEPLVVVSPSPSEAVELGRGLVLHDTEGNVAACWKRVRIHVKKANRKYLNFERESWTHLFLPAGGFAFVVVEERLQGLVTERLSFVQGATPESVAAGGFAPLVPLERLP